MQYNSIFTKFDNDSINQLICHLLGAVSINYCLNFEHTGVLLSSKEITANIVFNELTLSTSIHGDTYVVPRTGNLCRDIAEIFLVNKTGNELTDGYKIKTNISIETN